MLLVNCYNKCIIKLDWVKHKRTIWIAFAIVFLVAIFFLRATSVFKNEGVKVTQKGGLAYSTETLVDFVNKDTDGDKIPDWEENLWGTNPANKETTPGISDKVAIEKLKIQQEAEQDEQISVDYGETGTLTETDRFSRELFSTISALTQNGLVDQVTIDKLGSSLAEEINNPPVQKVFLLSELKIIKNDSVQAVTNYNNTLNNIFKKDPVNYTVIDVLQKFIIDEENVDVTVLSELDPIATQVKRIINDMVKMPVPQSLASLHLETINGFQRLLENINGMKLFDTDVIVALGAINQYETNADSLAKTLVNLNNAMKQKLSI